MKKGTYNKQKPPQKYSMYIITKVVSQHLIEYEGGKGGIVYIDWSIGLSRLKNVSTKSPSPTVSRKQVTN